jgi:hypothetical protein
MAPAPAHTPSTAATMGCGQCAHGLDQVARHAREHQQLGRLQAHQRADDLVHVAARAEVAAGAGDHHRLARRGVAQARNRSRSSA